MSDVKDGEENGVSAPVPHVEERDEAAGGSVRVLDAGSKLVQHVPGHIQSLKGLSHEMDLAF